MSDVLTASGFDEYEIDSYQYARQFASGTMEGAFIIATRQLTSGQIDSTLSFIDATRLLVVESGEMSSEGFDAVFADIKDELRDDTNEGVEYLYVRWGYWWVMKD